MRYIGVLFAMALFLCVPIAFPYGAFAQTSVEQRAALQAQLDQIEKDIANNQGSLAELQKARTTLEREISILDTKIRTAKLQIKQTDLTIKQIKGDISGKEKSIRQVDEKVARSRSSLAQILRHTNEIDDTSLATIMLASGTISDVFQQIDNFQSVQEALGKSFDELGALRSDLSGRKQALEEKQLEEQQVKNAQLLAKQAVERDAAKKQQILTVTKGTEKSYQQMIDEKKKKAAAIREALFGLRDSSAIPFGTAYDYAKAAGSATGVRPALILAILTQETDLGKNIGSCYVADLTTGNGVGKNTGKAISRVMKAPRDTEPFRTLTDALGRDWSRTPVSCPQSVGYGGAMGPGQFIPSTWVLYTSRLSKITGETTPDPWSARTAIFATALLMKDNGADGGTRESERKAALKYFAGSNWAKPANAIYGTNVLGHADDIQAQIDILNS